MGVAPVPTIGKAQKTRRPARRTFMRALPHLVPFFIYFLYLVIGSVIFMLLEGDNADIANHKALLRNMKSQLHEAIADASSYLSNETNWVELFENYTQLVTQTQPTQMQLGRYENPRESVGWTFSSSMLFCVITITTIGYGDLVPITYEGRIFVSIYAAFGIPLNVIFLADVGYLFAKVIVKVIRAIKLYKRRRRRAKAAARELRSTGNARPLSRFRRRRRKVAKRGKKFKHRKRPQPILKEGLPAASKGMSVHARFATKQPVLDNDDCVKDTTFVGQDGTDMVNRPNGGRDLSDIQVDAIENPPTYRKAKRNTLPGPAAKRKPKGVKNKSGGLSASRNMSVHARSLRRKAPEIRNDDNDDDNDNGHYTKRTPHGGRKRDFKRREGGISASRHMSVHARSLNRHRPEDIDSDEASSNEDENIKTVSEGLEVVTKDIMGFPNPQSNENLVRNDQLSFDAFGGAAQDRSSISMASEATTEQSSVVDDDNDSVDTEVPTVIVLTILISYICIGAVMMMYIEDWHYGEALYFTIITLTTIGFGDMAPIKNYSDETLFSYIIFTVFGLAVMSTCIALVQAKVLRAIDRITRKIRKHAEL